MTQGINHSRSEHTKLVDEYIYSKITVLPYKHLHQRHLTVRAAEWLLDLLTEKPFN